MSLKKWVKKRVALFLAFVAALLLIKYRHIPTVTIYKKSCKAFSEALKNHVPIFNGFHRNSSHYFDRGFEDQFGEKYAESNEHRLVLGDLNISSTSHPAMEATLSVPFLASELSKKLAVAVPEVNVVNLTTACKHLRINYKEPTCQTEKEECLQETLPENLEDRIRQLALRPNLQVPTKYMNVIHKMSSEIIGFHDIIIASALSSNHYEEGQAMMKNLHENVFPLLSNFTFVVYDLGLNKTEREEIRQFCRCTLLDFPFESFPEHVSRLNCFSWKVTIVRAVIEKANIAMWTDTSIRITDPPVLLNFFERARQRGLQLRYQPKNYRNPYHTLIQTFHYFGDSPCAHMAFYQGEAGYGIYHREPLVQRAVLDPWFGCAVRAECICPVDQEKVQVCRPALGQNIGLCMRNDQSTISLILAKLFRDKYRYFMVNVNSFQEVLKEDKYSYFKELRDLEKNSLHL